MSKKWVIPPQATVLVVDDNRSNAELLARIVVECGCNVQIAFNGLTALTIAASTPLDLILLNTTMPDMDGFEVCRQLKAQIQTQHIPIIFIDIFGNDNDKFKAFSLGAVDFIHKPFQIQDVLARAKCQPSIHSDDCTYCTLNEQKDQLIEQNQQLQKNITTVSQDLTTHKVIEVELYQKTQELDAFSNSLKQLHRLSLTDFNSLEELFSDYLQTGCNILGFAGGSVGRVQGQTYTLLSIQSTLGSFVPGLSIELNGTFCGIVVERKETIAFHHIGNADGLRSHPLYQALKLESYLGTPIWVDSQLFGTLCFFSTEPRLQKFEKHEQEIIELMAQRIGKFISFQQVEAKRKQAEEEVQLLLNLTQSITIATDFDHALEIALQILCDATGWAYGEVWLPNSDGTLLCCSPIWYCNRHSHSSTLINTIEQLRQAITGEVLPLGAGIAGRVGLSQQPEWTPDTTVLVEHWEAQADTEGWRSCPQLHLGCKAHLGVPIVVNWEQGIHATPMGTPANLNSNDNTANLLAVLVFFMPEGRPQDERLTQLVVAIASQLGFVLAQKQTETELEALFRAMTDVVVVRNWEGRCIKITPTSPNLFKPAQEMVGKTLHETFPVDVADLLLNTIQTSLKTQQPADVEYSLNLHRQKVWLSARISPLSDTLAILVARDISDRKQLELALQRSEAKLSNVLNNVDAAIATIRVFTNCSWTVEYRSVGYERIFGFPLEYFEADSNFWLANVVPEDLELYLSKLIEDVFAGRSGIVEYRFHHGDGTIHWISEIYTPYWDEMAHCWVVATVDTDISDRKHIEARLTRQQEFLRNVIDTPPNLIFAKDWNSNFILANQAVAEIYGTTVENLVGKSDADFNPSSVEVQHFLQDDREVISTQQPKLIEEFVTSASGETRCFQTIKKPITSIDGQSILVLGVATDITDRKQMEQALRLIVEGTAAKTGREFFHSLVRHLAEVLQVRYAFVTELIKPEKTRARTLAFWQGNKFGENFEYELADSPCEKVLAGEIICYQNSIQTHFPHHKHLAELRAESYFGIPLNDTQGNVLGHLKVLDSKPLIRQQFSEQILRIFAARAGAELERQQAEEALSALLAQTQQQSIELERARDTAEAANFAKSEFLANMSHELRTPLNVILGFTQIMARENSLTASIRDYLATINRSGEHLLELINDVLEMSKIESGKLSFKSSNFDLYNLLVNLESMFYLRAQSKGLALIVESTPETPQYIQTDEGKLRQVLVNLLGNAIKFTQTGTVILRVSVVQNQMVQQQNQMVQQQMAAYSESFLPTMIHTADIWLLQFEVSDTGVGIDPTELPTLFEPFVQSQSRTYHTEGTGLGLPITRKFVQVMQGSIGISSQLETGTTVQIIIPVQLTTPFQIRSLHLKHSAIHLVPGQATYRVLVVEDHADSRQLLITLLRSLGFEVQAAVDGQSAVDLWQCWQPHLIWMDMHLPILDGYEATKRIRALERDRQRQEIGNDSEKNRIGKSLGNEDTNASSSPSFASAFSPTVIIALTASAFEEDRAKVLAAGCNDFVRKPFREDLLVDKIRDYLGVQFVYTDSTSNLKKLSRPQHLDSQTIQSDLSAIMSVKWLEQFYQAANLGLDQKLLQLIAQIPETHHAIAILLTDLANNFCFDQLLTLIQPPEQ